MEGLATSHSKPVLILGGGINGAALARELVLNRVGVVLVDKADLASGATAASSRLIHGGLRYLEYGEFDLVRESLAERRRLLALAPQFVQPLRLFIPVERRWGGFLAAALRAAGIRQRAPRAAKPRSLWLIRMGLWFYDRYARGSGLPRRGVHHVGRGDVPRVNERTFRWLCSYSDAQVTYPERLVVALLRDARIMANESKTPFDVFTYHDAILKAGRVSISSNRDPRNSPIEIEPAALVNATGAWVDKTLARLDVPSRRLMGGTQGSHFVTSHACLRELLGGHGVYAEAEDGRPFFILPLGEATLVGTTDLPFDGDPASAVATEEELAYLLAGVRRVFPRAELTPADIDFHYSGVRPLPYAGEKTPASITRRHWTEEHAACDPPLFSLIGGKLTTCRSLAEEAVERILTKLNWRISANSRERALPGAEQLPTDPVGIQQLQTRISERTHCSLEQVQAVFPLSGTLAEKMLLGEDGSVFSDDNRASVHGTNVPRGFVRRVIREEWVSGLSDLVERRLMLLYHRRLHVNTLDELAQLLADEGRLGESEVEATITRLQAKFGKRIEGIAATQDRP